MNCTRCNGTGFLNHELLPADIADQGLTEILAHIEADSETVVSICDCCGDGEEWHGEPGSHYHAADPQGVDGKYGYNGGLAECH